jgi:hypothetical protein
MGVTSSGTSDTGVVTTGATHNITRNNRTSKRSGSNSDGSVNTAAITTTTTSYSCSSSSSTDTCTTPTQPSFWRQYTALVTREYLCVTRNPADVAGRTLTFAWVAAMVGLIYYNMPADASSMRSRINLLYSGLCFFLLMPFISMSLYSADKRFYVGDTAARLYKPLPYHLAKVMGEMGFGVV